jgi:methylenetetrahydrofolate dehydrogenase (NADP+)/methenyltetrahydrofolate cyclohydrolase
MGALIIDGSKIAQEIRLEISEEISRRKTRNASTPGLAAVLVGHDLASEIYVRNKQLACEEVGIFSEVFKLPEEISQSELIKNIDRLNQDDRFNGILIQLPLPSHIDERSVILSLNPNKDVDGLHPINMGRLLEGQPLFIPGTPAGIQQLLMRTGNDPIGKHVVICGRSNIVGKPAAALFLQKINGGNATVTICHTATQKIEQFTRSADILIAAIGKANTITADMVKDGSVIIDVGMNRVPDSTKRRGYRLTGDVDFDGVYEKVAAITPVPGGVGPMTVAMLIVNTLKAAQLAD